MVVAILAQGQASGAGFVVFESNRTGTWELYRVGLDGRGERDLTSAGADNQWPSISPDGQRIAWTKTEGSRVGIYSMAADGSGERLEASGGREASYLPDGRLFFNMKRADGKTALWVLPQHGAKPIEVFCPEAAGLRAAGAVEFSAGLGLDKLVFWSAKPRGTSLVGVKGELQQLIHDGCMPRFMPDGMHFIWVRDPGDFGIGRYGAGVNHATFFSLPTTHPYDHGYFPFLSADYRWLVYAACPPDQHDHGSANYQIFLQRIEQGRHVGEPVRLTQNEVTDRRPVVWTPEAGAFMGRLVQAHARGSLTLDTLGAVVPGFGVAAGAGGTKADYTRHFDFSKDPTAALSAFDFGGEQPKTDSKGLHLEGEAGAVLKQPIKPLIQAMKGRREFTIAMDVWVPDREEHRDGAFLRFKLADEPGNLAITQQGARCLVAFKDSEKPLDMNDPQLNGKMPKEGFNHLVLTYASGSLKLHINGKTVDSKKVSLDPDEWSEEATLVLGGRAGVWGKPWSGAIRSVHIVNRRLGGQDLDALERQVRKERPIAEQ